MGNLKNKIVSQTKHKNQFLEENKREELRFLQNRSKMIEEVAELFFNQICKSLENGIIHNSYSYSGLLFNRTIQKRFAMSQLTLSLAITSNKIDFKYFDAGDAWAANRWVLTCSTQSDLDHIVDLVNNKLLEEEIYVTEEVSLQKPIFSAAPGSYFKLSNNQHWWTSRCESVLSNYSQKTFFIFLD